MDIYINPIKSILKLYIYPNKASASPPVGPALGQFGLNIMAFSKSFNYDTQHININYILPVYIFILRNNSYFYIIKLPKLNYILSQFYIGFNVHYSKTKFIVTPYFLYEICLYKNYQINFLYNFKSLYIFFLLYFKTLGILLKNVKKKKFFK
jgi:hypothetical protein